MLQRSVPQRRRSPVRPTRIVIEDPDLALADLADLTTEGMDVHICSGPTSEHDSCPLFVDGRCSLGPCDVVVSNLGDQLGDAVEHAWHKTGTPTVRSANESVRARIGEGLAALWTAQQRRRDD